MDEEANSNFNPFNIYETDNQNDEVFNNINEELYYNLHKLTVQETLDNLLGEKIQKKIYSCK